MNRLFGVENFKQFQDLLKEKDVDEGFDEEGRSFVFNALCSRNDIDPRVKSKLEEYDSNIKSYVDHISAKRETPIRLKYFQHLSVLFTEIFLDRYFGDRVVLENDMNKSVETLMEQSNDYISPFSDDDLRKLAFWMATGSGKTLLL
ncbi:MAG: DEAD/DEAH box helicase family protein, partial [Candidatus Methanospirareceae archaeon]